MLLEGGKDTNLEPKLQTLLMELEAGLGSVLRKQNQRGAPAATDNLAGEC